MVSGLTPAHLLLRRPPDRAFSGELRVYLSSTELLSGNASPDGYTLTYYYSMFRWIVQPSAKVSEEGEKRKPPCRDFLRLSKAFGRHRRARKPFDFTSKIGDMRGDFRAILLAKSLPYTNERPGEWLAIRPVNACKTQKSGRSHFFDTKRKPPCRDFLTYRITQRYRRSAPRPPQPEGSEPRQSKRVWPQPSTAPGWRNRPRPWRRPAAFP